MLLFKLKVLLLLTIVGISAPRHGVSAYDSGNIPTRDSSNLEFYAILAVLSFSGLVYLLIGEYKDYKNSKHKKCD